MEIRLRRHKHRSLPDARPYWPALRGFDYRYGFPIKAELAEVIEAIGDEQERRELLGRLEAAAFRALVEIDLRELTDREGSA